MLEIFMFPVQLLLHYGYTALFIWSLFEGEIGLMLAGWLISQGKVFTYEHAIIVAISGAIIGDFTVFTIGKLLGKKARRWLCKRYREKQRSIEKWFKKWGAWVVVLERFIYGTHIPALLTVGMSGFGFFKFLFFDIIGVVLWAFTFVTIGYYFGQDAIQIILFVQKNILLVLFLVVLFVLYRKSKESS